MAVVHYTQVTESGLNGTQLNDDFVIHTKKDFLTNDTNVVFSHVVLSNDGISRPTARCLLETFLFQHATMSDKIITITDTRHTRRWFEGGVEFLRCTGDLAFFCSCPITTDHLRLWAHERTLGVPRNVDDLQSAEICRHYRCHRRRWSPDTVCATVFRRHRGGSSRTARSRNG